jgi:hypothetical protein
MRAFAYCSQSKEQKDAKSPSWRVGWSEEIAAEAFSVGLSQSHVGVQQGEIRLPRGRGGFPAAGLTLLVQSSTTRRPDKVRGPVLKVTR